MKIFGLSKADWEHIEARSAARARDRLRYHAINAKYRKSDCIHNLEGCECADALKED